jgi:hypothetical protein
MKVANEKFSEHRRECHDKGFLELDSQKFDRIPFCSEEELEIPASIYLAKKIEKSISMLDTSETETFNCRSLER